MSVWLKLIVLLYIYVCNISSDGSGVCSKNNLVTAQFKVVPDFGTYDYLQITLKSYNVAPDDEKTIRVSIEQPGSLKNVYTCYKSSTGSTYSRFDRDVFSLKAGSSSYMEGVLSCTWTFNIYDSIWPKGVDLLQDSSQSIAIYNGSRKVIVAQNTSQLPIYHAQYLKCCNKVHGNDKFLITFDQVEKQIRYRLYYWGYTNEATVTLTKKDGIKLQFECYHNSNLLKGYIINGTELISVDQQFIKPYVYYSEICSWATPFVLGDSRISIDTSTTVFDLLVENDRGAVYTEKDVTLKNSSHLIRSSFILMAFAVLFQTLASICS